MKAITLRNLPPALAQLIRRKSSEKRTSLNKVVISLLEESLGSGEKKGETLHHDLDTLAGSWSQEEASQFEEVLTRQRMIDPDVWK